jgi:uncharacterized protein YkwD
VLVCSLGLGSVSARSAPSPLEQRLLALVNHEREHAGSSKLAWNDRLASAALAHSKLLADHQGLSHQFAGEPTLEQRLSATGARFDAVAENVAEAPDVEAAHKGLMASPGHRANILDRNANAVGISIVQRGSQLFVTQDFAHVVLSYSEQQFRDAVVADVNQTRRAQGMRAVNVATDPKLRTAACAQGANADKIIGDLPGAAGLVVFSASDPGALPDDLRKAALDKTLARMSIGVCLQPGDTAGFSKFWVVAAFLR